MKWISRLSCLVLFTIVFAGCAQQEKNSQNKQTAQDEVTSQPITIAVSAEQPESGIVEAIVLLKNPNKQDVTVTFPTSQRFELIVKDETGKMLYTFSQEQVFTQAIEKETFKALESKRYEVRIELPQSSRADQIEASTIRQVEGTPESVMTDRQKIDNEKGE
ncbi:BsuPI-related putative proteinase inhibitor [Exiguobacterium sp. s192]|uniref:BsuPI-related putative proteinase inhibitor n=1 Tax=Exiguobacterium sp. s192 TaxID=2751206 RepID=UPI001BECAABE|nr:BsuPI-related putative proteinase inhibitor [Exiguobacterium sp. s192]